MYFPNTNATILCDIDGVIAASQEHTLSLAEQEHGADGDLNQMNSWNDDVDGTQFSMYELIKHYYDTKPRDYLLNMPTFPGVKESLETLQRHNTVKIVTHRPPEHNDLTVEWLQNNNIPFDEFVYDVPENKADVGGDVLIDDYYGNINDAARSGLFPILINRPYTERHKVNGGHLLYDSLQDVCTNTYNIEI